MLEKYDSPLLLKLLTQIHDFEEEKLINQRGLKSFFNVLNNSCLDIDEANKDDSLPTKQMALKLLEKHSYNFSKDP